jgi:uncharacterized 2Fe-2S/4Fe-4S cluster protein (DUF4445 family)
MIRVKFLPSDRTVAVPAGNTILQAAIEAGVPIEGVCGGNGMCGKCKVRLRMDNTKAGGGTPTFAELKFLTEDEIEAGWVLACQHLLFEDAVVLLRDLKDVHERKIGTDDSGKVGLHESSIRKLPVVLKKPSLEDQRADWERLIAALPIKNIAFSRQAASSLPQTLRKGKFNVTAVFDDAKLLAVEPGDTTARAFGLAIDIGTTTLAVYLTDLNQGIVLASGAATNPQNVFGADVISRIAYASGTPEALRELQKIAVEKINRIIESLTEKTHVNISEIYQVVVVGNTTMDHLFLGIDPSFLAQAPFIPVFTKPVEVKAGELGLAVLETSSVTVLPNVAGYVGSDTVGVMLAVGADRLEGVHLIVDIGTNGEIVLVGKGRILTCSTAAGPAFEGAKIQHGMRAAEGAIEKVRISSDVEAIAIGSGKPAGICGSGLVDALSEMVRTGIVEGSGRLLDRPERLASLSPALRQRLRTAGGQAEFVLVWGRDPADRADIVITQKDIREVQLAKGAIMAGIRVLMREMKVREEEIEQVLLAGAFGNYIGTASALGIGLLPSVPMEKIKAIGNAAGKGAQMVLLSVEERKRALVLAQRTRHIELSTDKGFQETFISSLSFDCNSQGRANL